MTFQFKKLIVPMMLAAAVPTFAFAQAPTNAPQQRGDATAQRTERLSPEARARLLDGRMAMIKTTLKLNDAQLKLWTPVEAYMRTESAQRQTMREQRRQAREQAGNTAAPSLTDRLDRGSAALASGAERMKAFSAVFKPFYESLDAEQKTLANIVMHEGRGGNRWAMHRGPGMRRQ